MIKNVIALYPGRFQPFGKHHATAFKWLEKQFGGANCYIVTSNVVNPPKSPFSFKDKQDIIRHYGLAERLVQVKNPYKSEEILSHLNPKDTAVVFMVGAKDMKEDPRFKIGRLQSGKASYFQDYETNKRNLKGFDEHGYLIVAPHISISIPGQGEMSGTSLRKALGAKIPRSQKINLFKSVFGWYDAKTANMIFNKLESMNESKLFSKGWWTESLSLTEVDLKTNTWKDFNLTTLSDDDMKVIWNMYTGTYAKQGLDFSADDFKELQHKYKAVYLEDVDGDSVADAFIVYKPTLFGNKISLLGTNDKKEAKKELLSKLFSLLKTKGWYIEASMKMEEILSKRSDINTVTDETVIKGVAGDKGLEMMKDGYYKRKLSKVDKSIVKRIYGRPNTASIKEGCMSTEQLKKHNAKTAKLKDFLENNIGKPFVYDFNQFPKTVVGVKIEESLLKEGGAASHMNHPFNIEWVKTGADLVKAFQQSVDYLKKGPASVKIDGVNASIRLITLDGKKTFVMDRGSNKPLDVKGITKAELKDRFGEGHGMIKVGGIVLDIFNDSIPACITALKKLGLWDNPNIMFNIEYVAGSTNVLAYEKNFLAIHGLLEIQQVTPTKRQTKEIAYSKLVMQDLLNNLAPEAKKRGYEVLGSIPTTLEGEPDLKSALNKKYTIAMSPSSKETKTLSQWLAKAKVPDGTLKTVDGKTISALSKEVLIKIADGIPLNEFVANPKDNQAAIDGFVIYMATMKLGDAILDKLTSPLGPVNQHEGIVIRDKSISAKPYKITGKFILGGLASTFRK